MDKLEQIAAMIESLSESHYARDVQGYVARRQWFQLAQEIRANAPTDVPLPNLSSIQFRLE